MTAGQWVATRYARNLAVTQRVVGNDELVHHQIARWLPTDRYRGGLPIIHSLNGFRLHETAVYFER
jgi:hypothetical protein